MGRHLSLRKRSHLHINKQDSICDPSEIAIFDLFFLSYPEREKKKKLDQGDLATLHSQRFLIIRDFQLLYFCHCELDIVKSLGYISEETDTE